MVVTTLMPVPDAMPGWLPPAEKAIGTMLAMPRPRQGEGGDGQPRPWRQAGDQHAAGGDQAGYAQRRDRAEAIAHAVAEEAHDRHGAGKAGKGEAGGGEVGAEFLLQIKRCPVEHRAFRDHGEQRDQADEIDGRRARQREFGVLVRDRAIVGDEVAAATTSTSKATTVTMPHAARWP